MTFRISFSINHWAFIRAKLHTSFFPIWRKSTRKRSDQDSKVKNRCLNQEERSQREVVRGWKGFVKGAYWVGGFTMGFVKTIERGLNVRSLFSPWNGADLDPLLYQPLTIRCSTFLDFKNFEKAVDENWTELLIIKQS